MKRGIVFMFMCFSSVMLMAQTTVIIGGTVHTGDGKVIEKGRVVMQNGMIVKVDEVNSSEGFANATVIQATGKQIYPGVICLNTLMGLNEIDAVRATRDYNETGTLNPNARTLIAYNTDSKILPTALFNGVLSAQIVPTGGIISGQSSMMKTAGWNWEDAQIKADEGMHLSWPELSPWGDITKQQERLGKEMQAIEDFFASAFQYYNTAKPEEINLRLEAMKGIFSGEKRLYIHVSGEEGIVRSIQFVKQYAGIKPVLVGAESAYKMTDFIRNSQIPVIVNLTHRLPKYGHEDVDLPYRLPALLWKAGIKVAIGSSGSWESRNVMFQAGTVAAYGLTKEEALQCITGNAAEISGTETSIGTLAVGKRASVVISEGDLLDMKTNKLFQVFIDGVSINLKGQQQDLYKKYMDKYGFTR